jgi:hypothetical protein
MRAYLWMTLGMTVWACGGSAFTSVEADGGSDGSGDAAGADNATAGGGRSSGGNVGNGGKPGTAGKPGVGGSTPLGGATNVGGLGIAGDVVIAGSGTVAGQPGTGGTGPDPSDQVCPKSEPLAGGGCADGLTCSYNKDLRPNCRVRAKCDGGKWSVDDPECEPLQECQGVQPGTMCDDSVAASCMIEGYIYCVCTGCSGAGPCSNETVWRCTEGPDSNICPHVMPNEGQTCEGEVECPYGSCATDTSMVVSCNGATWGWTSAQCPQ